MVGATLLWLAACSAGTADDKDESANVADTSSPDSVESGHLDSDRTDSGPDSADDTGTPPPADLDGDGHIDVAAGGDDCNDRNDTVYPGAEEWCDPVDHDCNGEILEDGVCAKVQSGSVITPIAVSGSVAAPTLVDDVTGDGWPDLVAMSTTGAIDQPQAFLFDKIPDRASVAPNPSDVATRIWVADASYGGVSPEGNLEAGDLDGDGIGEISFVNSYGKVGYFNFHGPISGGGVESSFGEYDSSWTPTYTYGAYGVPSAGNSDYDGDGLSDMVGAFYDLDSGRNYNCVYFGGSGQNDYVTLGPYAVDSLANPGDADGDGLDDISFGNAALYFASGGALRGAEEGDYMTLAFLTIDTHGTPYLAAPIDYTGDGAADFIVGDQEHDGLGEHDGALLWYSGALRGTIDESASIGSLLGDDDHRIGSVAYGDIDGDGLPELLAGAKEGTNVFPGTMGVPESGTAYANPKRLTVAHLWYVTGREGSTSRDFTRDGIPDVGMYDRDRQLVGVYSGWEIPWNEDKYW